MRVALLTDTHPPEVNGAARTLSRLVVHRERRGHAVALVSPAGTGTGAPSEPSQDLRLRIPCIPFPSTLTMRRSLSRGSPGRGVGRFSGDSTPRPWPRIPSGVVDTDLEVAR